MIGTEHLYLSSSLKEHSQSFVQYLKVLATNNPQGKGCDCFRVSYIALLWGTQCFSHCAFCIFAWYLYHGSMLYHHTSSTVPEHLHLMLIR